MSHFVGFRCSNQVTHGSNSIGCGPIGKGNSTSPSKVQLNGSKTSLFHSPKPSRKAGVVPRLIPVEEGGASVASMGFEKGGMSGGCGVRAVAGPDVENESAYSGLVGLLRAASNT